MIDYINIPSDGGEERKVFTTATDKPAPDKSKALKVLLLESPEDLGIMVDVIPKGVGQVKEPSISMATMSNKILPSDTEHELSQIVDETDLDITSPNTFQGFATASVFYSSRFIEQGKKIKALDELNKGEYNAVMNKILFMQFAVAGQGFRKGETNKATITITDMIVAGTKVKRQFRTKKSNLKLIIASDIAETLTEIDFASLDRFFGAIEISATISSSVMVFDSGVCCIYARDLVRQLNKYTLSAKGIWRSDISVEYGGSSLGFQTITLTA